MRKFLHTAGTAALFFGIASAASFVPNAAEAAPSVREGQGIITRLGPHASAVTYWVGAPDGWHVVTTIDTTTDRDVDEQDHAIIRFSSVLLPGQSQMISVPAAMDAPQPMLRVRRVADRVEVEQEPALRD
jgi:hypothetical protein